MRGPKTATTARARNLRRVDNDAEHALWSELRDRRLNGFKFVRQFRIGPYFADFACRDRMLVVELDGIQHIDSAHDVRRDAFMVGKGWSVLRFWNVDVFVDRVPLLETLVAALEGRLDREIDAPDLRFRAALGYGEVA
jgi:very-short-patch-repair endonuclease